MADVRVPEGVWFRIREQALRAAGHRPRLVVWRPVWFGLSGLVAALLVIVLLSGSRNRGGGPPESTASGLVARVVETACEGSSVSGSRSRGSGPEASPAMPERVEVADVVERRSAVRTRGSAGSPIRADGADRNQRADSVVVTSMGEEVVLKPGELLREYLGGMRRAADDARAAMLENPGHPRVRQVLTSATVNRAVVLDELSTGGE